MINMAGGRAMLRAKGELSTAQQTAIGPIEGNAAIAVLETADAASATIVTHNGSDGQLTSTTGDLTFRTGDVFSGTETERMRVTQGGKVGIGTSKPEAELDVAGIIRSSEGFRFMNGSTLAVNEKGGLSVTKADGTVTPQVVGTGTLNRIAKWTETGGAGTLGDTLLFENNGVMGVNTSTPGTLNGVTFQTIPFHVFRPGTSSYAAIDASGLGSFAGLILNRSTAAANNHMWVIDSQPASGGNDSLLGFSTYSDAGLPTVRMSVSRVGLVSIPGALHAPTMSYASVVSGSNAGNAGAVPSDATVLEIGDNFTPGSAATVVLPASAANGTILTFGTSDIDGAVVFGVTAVPGGSYSFNVNQSARFVRVGGVWKFMGQ
jgi:hypothetical protein